MPLTQKFILNFTESQQEEGAKLLPSTARIFGGQDRIQVEIKDGNDILTTTVTLVDKKITTSCDCGNAQPCHHVWTALLVANQCEDLTLALKRNVPRQFATQNQQQDQDDDLTYQPVKSGRLSYEEREITSDAPRTFQARPAFVLKSDLVNQPAASQILLVIPIDFRPEPNTIRFDVYWRPRPKAGEAPAPAKPYYVDKDTVIDNATVLSMQSLAIPSDGLPPNAYLLTLDIAIQILDNLGPDDLIRWRDKNEIPPKLHKLEYDKSLPLDLDWTLEPIELGFLPSLRFGSIPQNQIKAFFPPKLILTDSSLKHVNCHNADEFALNQLASPQKVLTSDQARQFVRKLTLRTSVKLEGIPNEIKPEFLTPDPKGKLYVRTAVYKFRGQEQLHAILSFDYGGTTIEEFDQRNALPHGKGNEIILRNAIAEENLKLKLQSLGFRFNDKPHNEELGWKLLPAKLDEAVRTLVMEDWYITAEGKTYRKPKTKQPTVKSGLDWFDLEANVDFDDLSVPLPTILKAQAQGDKAVRLDDGTYGLLPLDWLQNFTPLTELGEQAGDAIRFKQEQAVLVNQLLDNQVVQFDQLFKQSVQYYQDIPQNPLDPPSTFKATLRPYQREGLGWLVAMSKRRLGACLADDMGLGKTIQILAFIDTRVQNGSQAPALVVVPKSLLFNWENEARKFAPHLKVAIYAGSDRSQLLRHINRFNIVLTTYGTVRNDSIQLAKIHFDSCILDESQTIKNANAAAAEAVKIIKADMKIAMTGTPIENSLSELASQLDFLNPGLFGKLLASAKPNQNGQLNERTTTRLKNAVRPFILRRTKKQVASDLPEKTEDIIFCELEPEQRNEYDQLKKYYQKQLLDKEDDKVAGQSTMDTLVALLRLRQAACHPALIDHNRATDNSAKLDLILENILQLSQQNHKILVFSQFTAFLKLVANRLDNLKLTYNYLDGQTIDRQQQVEDFQNNPDSVAFLISLKAGGVGLNLTAADYIFLLDPWWNPATEAQAIDRAYRIGQKNHVFAYKIIAKDTIEEKVLKMQQNKKQLADAILDADNAGAPPKLTREDLLFLLAD